MVSALLIVLKIIVLQLLFFLLIQVIVIGEIFSDQPIFDGEDRADGQLKFSIIRRSSAGDKFHNDVLVSRWIDLNHFIMQVWKSLL
ncbi:hypothetical protein SAMN05421765_1788 [Kaistella antarctica]|uniref:Uncharacterized protein n=1 Tax=Kaistella antarctica TaxID=266748 RepID=A0A448NQG7_9FLAO|nr:hypothetical protein SAMN05421765_1788 [Kaistella antarctica]VEH98889.1 Uncharacterised protein [Kaistella antarctica]